MGKTIVCDVPEIDAGGVSYSAVLVKQTNITTLKVIQQLIKPQLTKQLFWLKMKCSITKLIENYFSYN